MTYEEFLENPKLAEIFNLNSERVVNYIKERLLLLKPRENDVQGWVYIYCR